MADPTDQDTPDRQAGERAVANTAVLAAGEVVGKLASFVLFAVLARVAGPADLGEFLFALAWSQISVTPVGLGADRYVLRRLAKDREALAHLMWGTFELKLLRSLLIVAVSFAAVNLLGYDEQVRVAVYVLTAGMLLESLSHTLMHVFGAFERGGLVATGVVMQRVTAAALGLMALAAGYGIVAVSVAFLIGAAVRLAISLEVLRRHIGLPRPVFSTAARRELRSRGLPFAAQDIFGLILDKLDILILSFLASNAVVGLYGAAYRLLEATSFVAFSLAGAFSAQYTYLRHDTRPPVGVVFGRSLKLSLLLLVPIAVAYATLAEPLCRLFFGSELVGAAEPLRLLAPVVVLYALVILSSSLVVSRRDPRVIVVVIGLGVLLNVGLNFALIPALDANGAAAAMLISELALVAAATTIAVRTVGGVPAVSTVAAPALGGGAMAIVTLLLSAHLVPALAAGAVTYLCVCLLVDLKASPGDLRFARDLIQTRARRLRARPMAAGRDSQ